MAVHIIEKEKNSLYTVNGKEVYLDGNNNWIARQELTSVELATFNAFKEAKGLS